MSAPAFFERRDQGQFVATEYARGPWDPTACHGGPVAALLARAAEQCDTGGIDWHLARISVELVRAVPIERVLTVDSAVERPGRKVSLVAATITVDGTEVARMRALRIRLAAIDLPPAIPDGLIPPLASVDGARPEVMRFPGVSAATAFHTHGCEHRYTEGGANALGPVGVWIRLIVPVLEDEEPTGVQRAVAAADFGNGVSAAIDFGQYIFINPDLTVHLARPVEGEWIGMRTESLYASTGTGLAESALFDSAGRLGRSAQSLLVDMR